jgi:hypothetical protein
MLDSKYFIWQWLGASTGWSVIGNDGVLLGGVVSQYPLCGISDSTIAPLQIAVKAKTVYAIQANTGVGNAYGVYEWSPGDTCWTALPSVGEAGSLATDNSTSSGPKVWATVGSTIYACY